jgi:CMP-N-acetylneuraminic acid synthetase
MPETTQPLVSLIIRTKNEERWIASCLRAVFSQTYRNIEVIIVDNGSTDRTLMRAQEFPVRLVHIEDFLPGKALNDGIRAARGEYLVCLSGHCIPVNAHWLESLVHDLSDPAVAGVYGRQEPLSYSSDFDKRDLITVFGLDRKIQIRDSFFHNANSAFRREVWERHPFDEQVTNIEDRVWGQQVISAGMKIVYEPEASVYHWHGIHQDLNSERCSNVVRILESLHGLLPKAAHHNPGALKIVAVIPVRGASRPLNGTTLLSYTVRAARASRLIKDVVVATDDEATARLAQSLGARTPFLRPKELSEDYVDVTDVLRYALDQIEHHDGVPDLVVMLEETYPFRTPHMLDAMITRLVTEGLDTVIAARKETRGIWLETAGETKLLAEGFMPRQLKQSHAMVGLLGLGCVTHPMFLRQGDLFGGKLGIYEVADPLAAIEVRDAATLELASKMIDAWWDAAGAQNQEAS